MEPGTGKDVVNHGGEPVSMMCQCCARLCRVMNSILAKTGLNMAQCHALGVLESGGPTTMGNLARELGVSLGAATNTADKLVDAGYAARKRSESDRRVVNIELTPQGADVLKHGIAEVAGVWSGVLEALEPDERDEFFKHYREILSAAEDACAVAKRNSHTGPQE